MEKERERERKSTTCAGCGPHKSYFKWRVDELQVIEDKQRQRA